MVAVLVVVIGCLFAVLSFIDFLRTKNGRAGKAILQFTPRMKAFYRRIVERLSTGKAVFIAAMLAGAVIAIGEFLCTGQLFAATVLYYFDASAGNMMVGALIFLLYTCLLYTSCSLHCKKGRSMRCWAKTAQGNPRSSRFSRASKSATEGQCCWREKMCIRDRSHRVRPAPR